MNASNRPITADRSPDLSPEPGCGGNGARRAQENVRILRPSRRKNCRTDEVTKPNGLNLIVIIADTFGGIPPL